MARSLVNISTIFVVCLFSTLIAAQSYDSGQRDRYVIESGFFKVLQMPTRQKQGRIQVFESSEQIMTGCQTCGGKFYFDNNLRIRVGHEGSMFTLEHLLIFPQQSAYFVVDDGNVVTIGFSELLLDEAAEAKLQSLQIQ